MSSSCLQRQVMLCQLTRSPKTMTTNISKRYELSQAVWSTLIINGKLLPGITYYMLESNDSWCSYWMKMDSKCQSVLHRHTDVELITILSGSVQDSTGAHYEPGDCIVYTINSEHQLYSANGCTMLVVESKPPIIY
ncbi:hypothetical protein FW789_22250 [Pseudomonas sp. 1121_17]